MNECRIVGDSRFRVYLLIVYMRSKNQKYTYFICISLNYRMSWDDMIYFLLYTYMNIYSLSGILFIKLWYLRAWTFFTWVQYINVMFITRSLIYIYTNHPRIDSSKITMFLRSLGLKSRKETWKIWTHLSLGYTECRCVVSVSPQKSNTSIIIL